MTAVSPRTAWSKPGRIGGSRAATPPPAHVTPAGLDSSAKGTPARVYVVQPGDTLWSIAEHFYGNGCDWDRIYHANQPQISDPNVIRAGQKLTIPGSAGAVFTQAYVALMNQLLHWSGGNVQMALAAYNAAQGNWQAGLGYASTIISIAG